MPRKTYPYDKFKLTPKNVLRKVDGFGKPIPAFNLGGNTKFQTVPGGILTLVILMVTLSYSFNKFVDMSAGKNPNITQSSVPDYYGQSDQLNLANDTNFRLAVGTRWHEYAADQSLQYDPQYTRWFARITTKEKDVTTKTDLLMHECTQEDFDDFYPLREEDVETYETLTEGQSTF